MMIIMGINTVMIVKEIYNAGKPITLHQNPRAGENQGHKTNCGYQHVTSCVSENFFTAERI